MMQTPSARPTHAHRNPRIAIAGCAARYPARAPRRCGPRHGPPPASTVPVSAPVAAAAPVTAPATSTAHAAPVVPGQEATVEIPSIRVSLPVVRGGQDVIDTGVAAHYESAQWRPPTGPGRPGTYWLAAHNTTEGSPFENLPAIALGAEIRIISPDGTVFTYEVTFRDRVGTATTFETVYGQDRDREAHRPPDVRRHSPPPARARDAHLGHLRLTVPAPRGAGTEAWDRRHRFSPTPALPENIPGRARLVPEVVRIVNAARRSSEACWRRHRTRSSVSGRTRVHRPGQRPGRAAVRLCQREELVGRPVETPGPGIEACGAPARPRGGTWPIPVRDPWSREWSWPPAARTAELPGRDLAVADRDRGGPAGRRPRSGT